MKKILLAGILILLLFIGSAAAVTVNYAQSQGIPLSTARENANSALVSYVIQGKLGTSAVLWKGVYLSDTPIIIYDQSGVVYSYIFDIINKDGKIVGQVNAAGNKLVGVPVISIEKTPRSFDPGLIIPKVSGLAKAEYADSRIDYVVFIVGEDQKIGIMVILSEQNGLTHRMIYNIQTFKLKSERIAYQGLIDASTPASVFVSMSSSSANRAIQNYDSKSTTTARVVPLLRRFTPMNSLNITNNKIPGVSTIKSVEKGTVLSAYQPATMVSGQMPTYTTARPLNLQNGKTFVPSPTTRQPLPASRFYPV
jgi:hypothetical protein